MPHSSMVYQSNSLGEIQENSMLFIFGCFSMNNRMCLMLP